MKPDFSVLMAAYDSAATIAGSLDSLLAQTHTSWEAIVVDDGSSDETAQIARGYARRDPRITVLSKPNGGSASARNLAASRATAPLWTLLDADDQYLPEYFERMLRFVGEHPGFDIFSSDGYVFSSGAARRADDLQPDSAERSYTAEDLLVRNRFRVLTTFRREVFDLAGGFDEDRGMLIEDWDFWLHAMLRGARHVHDPERLWLYRVSEGQKTSDPLRGARADAYLLDKLIASGELEGRRLRIARASRRATARLIRTLEGRVARAELERRLADGEVAGARRAYVAAWRGFASGPKYLVGLAAMLVSPRLYVRLAGASTGAPADGDGEGRGPARKR